MFYIWIEDLYPTRGGAMTLYPSAESAICMAEFFLKDGWSKPIVRNAATGEEIDW